MSGEMWTFVGVAGVAVVVTVVAVIVLFARLLRARRMLSDAGIPLSNKLTFWGAIAYVISPVDLLPDPILLDDIGVLLLALRSLHGAAEAAGLTGGREPGDGKRSGEGKRSGGGTSSGGTGASGSAKSLRSGRRS
ncbi:YkvA family protein [Streptomyces sp. XM4193]|uniref:YkvA family protein n=1 Tax=Streptomyces sp. XM4193 TaxID=2929782 RepID=UPI0027E39EC5|nr:YkvA family protein [Streptomyces sp. XM4193]